LEITPILGQIHPFLDILGAGKRLSESEARNQKCGKPVNGMYVTGEREHQIGSRPACRMHVLVQYRAGRSVTPRFTVPSRRGWTGRVYEYEYEVRVWCEYQCECDQYQYQCE
jgi:hypothetical protein